MQIPFNVVRVQEARAVRPHLMKYQPFSDILAVAERSWRTSRFFRFDDVVRAAGHRHILSTFWGDDWRPDVEQALWLQTGTRGVLVTEEMFQLSPQPLDTQGNVIINPQTGAPLTWFEAFQLPHFAKRFIAGPKRLGVGLCHADAFGGALDMAKIETRFANSVGVMSAVVGRQRDLEGLGLIPNAGQALIERRP